MNFKYNYQGYSNGTCTMWSLIHLTWNKWLLQKINKLFLLLSWLCEDLFEHMLQEFWTSGYSALSPVDVIFCNGNFGVSFSSLGNDGLDLGFAPLDDNADAWGWVEGGGGGGGGTSYLLSSLRTATLTWSLSSKVAPAHVILGFTQASLRPSCI